MLEFLIGPVAPYIIAVCFIGWAIDTIIGHPLYYLILASIENAVDTDGYKSIVQKYYNKLSHKIKCDRDEREFIEMYYDATISELIREGDIKTIYILQKQYLRGDLDAVLELLTLILYGNENIEGMLSE